jgi:hypothetical protein
MLVLFVSRNSKQPNLIQAAYDEDEGEHRQGQGLMQPWYLKIRAGCAWADYK